MKISYDFTQFFAAKIGFIRMNVEIFFQKNVHSIADRAILAKNIVRFCTILRPSVLSGIRLKCDRGQVRVTLLLPHA